MSTSKKPTPKKQEPPADQPQENTEAPMAAPGPAIEDRTAALELAIIELEQRIHQLERNCKASHGMR
jgi:hypothetical protein